MPCRDGPRPVTDCTLCNDPSIPRTQHIPINRAHTLPTKNTLCKSSTESGSTGEMLTYSGSLLIWLWIDAAWLF